MKIRNGFVSNSSSSSFILGYSKDKVLTDPKDIVEYIKNFPDNTVIIKGWDCGEGDDIFELSENQKSMIRRFPQEFIKKNTRLVEREKCVDADNEDGYTVETVKVPAIMAYVDSPKLKRIADWYKDIEIDMSDLGNDPSDEYSSNEFIELNIKASEGDLSAKEERDRIDNWYTIKGEREKAAYKKYIEEEEAELASDLMDDGLTNVAVERVEISNRSCDEDTGEDSYFPERYLTDESSDYDTDYYQVKKYKRGKSQPYAVSYDGCFTDKKNIVWYLERANLNSQIYMCWTNPVYNSMYDCEDNSYDFFEVGEKEAEIILNNKEKFINGDRECVLFSGAEIITGSVDEIRWGTELTTGYGKVVVIPKGDDLPDFKKNALIYEEY